MFRKKNLNRHDKIINLILRKIETLLLEMRDDGKDLKNLKLKKFQKTHHIDCKCSFCTFASTKNDPRLRGLTEDGFKIYLSGDKKVFSSGK